MANPIVNEGTGPYLWSYQLPYLDSTGALNSYKSSDALAWLSKAGRYTTGISNNQAAQHWAMHTILLYALWCNAVGGLYETKDIGPQAAAGGGQFGWT